MWDRCTWKRSTSNCVRSDTYSKLQFEPLRQIMQHLRGTWVRNLAKWLLHWLAHTHQLQLRTVTLHERIKALHYFELRFPPYINLHLHTSIPRDFPYQHTRSIHTCTQYTRITTILSSLLCLCVQVSRVVWGMHTQIHQLSPHDAATQSFVFEAHTHHTEKHQDAMRGWVWTC